MANETIEEIILRLETEGFDEAEKNVESLGDTVKKADKETKDYGKTLLDTAGDAQVFGVSLNALKGGLQQGVNTIKLAVTSLKSFKVALASTGVGLIIIALGSLVAWLKTTVEGTEFLSDAFTAVGVVASKLIEVLVKIFNGLRAIVQGNFSEGIGQITGAFNGLSDSIAQAVTETVALERALRDLEFRSTSNNVTIAQTRKLLAEFKRESDDVTKSIEDRIVAAEKAQERLSTINRLELQEIQERLELNLQALLLEEEGSVRRQEILEERKQLGIELFDIETSNTEASIELQNKLNSLIIERNNGLKAQQESLGDLQIENKKVEQGITKDTTTELNKRVDASIAADTARMQSAEARALREQQLLEAQSAREVQTAKDVFTSIGILSNQAAIFNQAIALVEAFINVEKAISVAIASAPWPLNLPAIGFAGLKGAATIAAISRETVPSAPTFSHGGLINGASHAFGGVHIEAEGGEAIINKRSTKMFKRELSMINQAGGGVPFMRLGGVVPTQGNTTSPFIDLERAMVSNRPVLVTSDLHEVEAGVLITEALTTL